MISFSDFHRHLEQPLATFLAKKFATLLLSGPADQQTSPPDHQGATENTAIVAGVAAALLLLVALTLLAVYYINTHPTVAPPFYLMQVRQYRPCYPFSHTPCPRTDSSPPHVSSLLQQRSNNYWPSMKFRNQGCGSSYTEVELGAQEKDGFIEAEQCC